MALASDKFLHDVGASYLPNKEGEQRYFIIVITNKWKRSEGGHLRKTEVSPQLTGMPHRHAWCEVDKYINRAKEIWERYFQRGSKLKISTGPQTSKFSREPFSKSLL